MASEELKTLEMIIFDKENREYEVEQRTKETKVAVLRLKRGCFEGESRLKVKEDQCQEK